MITSVTSTLLFCAVGWMTAVNFMIDSDFKWVLLAMALLWACSLVLFWFENRARR